MADVFSKDKRSEIMSRIRSKNTEPELILFKIAKELYAKGVRYRKHSSHIFGKPDLAILKYKVAIFIDSEFWHGKSFNSWKNRLPKKYWQEKIARNIRRDKEVNRQLKKQGWLIIRLWAKDLIKNPSRVKMILYNKLKNL